ncbi:hypothetical protein GCM10010503_36020 [Streptomyces lucensis JCM 4490]|uniref:Uncharacterized protein n=1 Tax=Streptomyces lucensis JCM 4490 TaxID=1306176 RepID=A0A918J8Z7_9ACTN|nr:hypothetical protein [Streptomyces lucensis]GGW55727.1 hypothetical protein GCM10010503_36020 [Streptomyces lucensis JCM 4490]
MSSTADDPNADEQPLPAEQRLPTEGEPHSERHLRRWHWRRLLRGRIRPLLAAAVAGVLLGVGGTAWQTQAGPFAPDEVCWGALSRDDLAATFREPEDVKVVEAPVLYGARSMEGPTGSCQLSNSDGDEWALTARVHRLDDRAGDDGMWADEFLSARLTPLGGGLLGMASDNRAWLAIPDGCLGRPGDLDGPTVVDIAQGGWISGMEPRTEERDALARMVVKLVNKVSADLGCTGTIADPVERLPKAAHYTRTEKPDALCGIKGLTLGRKRKADQDPMITVGHGPVRTCDRDITGSQPVQRLMTVEDPRLAAVFTRMTLHEGDRVRSAAGYGGLGPNLGIFRTRCQAGETVFLVQVNDAGLSADLRTLFPLYVEAEAARLGCGPLKLKLPPPAGSR